MEKKIENSLNSREEKKDVYNLKLFFKALKPILLSHHPNCKKFENHTFKIGKYNLCIGCYIGYPIAITMIILFYCLHLELLIESKLLLILGLVLLASFFLSPLHLTKIKFIKIIQKACIGIGAAFLFWWIWTLTDSFFINFLYFLAIFGILLTLLNGYHAYSFYSTCKKCEFSLDWNNCPGFEDHRKYLEENNLPNIFSKNVKIKIKKIKE